jgi:hypothetical protein
MGGNMKFICEKHPELQIGLDISFKKGVYETNDEKKIKSIEKLAKAFGISILKEDGKVSEDKGVESVEIQEEDLEDLSFLQNMSKEEIIDFAEANCQITLNKSMSKEKMIEAIENFMQS